MRRALLNAKFPINYLLTASRSSSTPIPNTKISHSFSYRSKFRFFSAVNENPSTDKLNPNSESTTVSPPPPKDFKVQDVSNKDLEIPGFGLIDMGMFPELEQMHPKTLNVIRDFMYAANNPHVLRDLVNDPQLREYIEQKFKIGRELNDPALQQRMEALRMEALKNPDRLRKMLHNADRICRQLDVLDANLNPCEAIFGGDDLDRAAQNQAANPANTGGALGGAETTTGSPAPSTDPLPNPLAADAAQVMSVKPGGTSHGGSPFPGLGSSGLGDNGDMFPDLEQMHPHTLKVMRGFMHLLNPDVYLETANDPIIRQIADRNPTIAQQLNNPAIIRRTLEVLRKEVLKNPQRLREMMGNMDRVLKRIDKDGQGANLNLFEAVFGSGYPGGAAQNQTANPGGDLGGAAQNQTANPATTGGDLGGAETTTGFPHPSTDPLPNLWGAAGGTVNANNPKPDGGVDDVSNSEIVTFNVRLLNGKNFVIKANPNVSVKAFKSVLEHNCDVPAGEQRLVYKGRVLYDDDHETLKTYGLESDHTVHLIRGSGGLSWIERTPSQLFGPRMHFIQAMHYSNPQFRKMMEDPEFKRMFPESNMEQWMTLNETVFSELTKGPVPPEELYAAQLGQLQMMGFLDTNENLQALIAHSGDVYGTVELLTILSNYH